jgi:hypothetical protein
MGYAFLLDCFDPRFLSPINTISSLYDIVFICAVFWEKIKMAEKVEIDIPGIGLIEAKNAATEATLQEILKVMQGTQKAVQQQAKGKPGSNQGGGGGGGSGGKGAEDQNGLGKRIKETANSYKGMGGAAKVAGTGFKLVGQSAHLATFAMSGLAAGAGAAAGAVISLGKNTLDLGAKFADTLERMSKVGDSTESAASALSMIPGVGGALSGVFGAVAGAVEKSVASYQTAASVGATFGGSVQAMSTAAGGAGMTLDQFAGLIKSNAENLIYLGGTTEAGAKQFAGLAKELQGSGAGAELQRLGFTTEQINGGMAKYIGILGKTGALSGMTTSQIAAASGSYLKELDGLAKITGQTREAKQAEQDALMKDAQVRAAMAGMDAESQKQMMNYITSFPKEQQAAIKDMIATGNVTSEEAIKLQSMLPGVAEQTMQFGRTMQAGGKINADQMNSARNNAIKEAKDSVMRNKARGMYDKESGEAYVGAANLAAMEIDGLSKAMGEQSKATDKANLAENLTKAKQRLAEFSNTFQQALANPAMLDMLMKSFETLATFVQQVIVPAFNIFAQILSAIIPVVTNLLLPAFKALGDFMQSTIVPGFNILGIFVRDALVPIFKQAFSIVSNVVGSLFDFLGIANDTVDGLGSFEETLYTISDFIEDNLHEVLIGFGVLMGTVLVAKLVAWGAGVLASLAPLGSFVMGLASGALGLLKLAAQLLLTTAGFLLMNLPILAVVTAVGLLAYGFKKMGGDLSILGDAFKWAKSMIETTLLYYKMTIFKILDLIPGVSFKKEIEEVGKELKANEDERAKLEQDMAARRKANLQAEADAEAKKLADEKAAKDAAMNQENADKAKAAKRAEDREARKSRREQDAIKNKENAELSAIDKKEEREKAAAEEAKGVTVDKSDPIQMLKTFANQQKSALTQEAKALDDKEKARSDLALASQEMAKAVEQSGKATNDMERKAAAERIKAAEERLSKTTKANEAADDTVNKAKERMALAKQGKDPGAVATGSPPSAGTTTATSTAIATPTVDKAAVTEGVGNLYQQTQDAMNKGIKYGFGSKDLKTGAIDCSGWIANINTNMMNSINKEAGKEIYGKEAKKAFQGSAADIIKNVSAAGGGMLEGSKNIRANLKEGMLIGEDNGEKGWDAGRHKGIDHITQTVKDPKTGKLMISESQGGKGVTLTDPEEYFAKKEKKGVKLFGTDMTAMAKGGEGRTTAPPSAMASVPKPEDAAKARTDAAANDPRRTDKTQTPATAAEPKREETLQSLIRDGITPTTMAFQELINKGIKPFQSVMSSGIQIKTPLGQVPAKDSLSPGEEIVKTRGMFDTDASKSFVAMAKNMSPSTSFETPKSEIIAQAEKAAAEKAELEKQQAEYREKLKQEEAMAMTGPSSQEGALSGSSDLNTALAELIAISKRTADLNEKQLSVQSSLSGDLFA